MDFDNTLEQLNITLGDTDNVTFTPEEKQRALKKAWNDQYVVATLWDNSLSFSRSNFQYTIPTSLTTVKDIYTNISGSTNPEPIPNDMWEVVDGKIQFNTDARYTIPEGQVLSIKGNYKIDPNFDTLDNVNLQEYVSALAGYNTLTLLTFKKANLFLKNDTTMSELIALRRELSNEVREFRLRLQKEYESA